MIVLNDDERHTALNQLEFLRKSIENETFEYDNAKINITITIGAIKYQNDISLEKWVELADKKMYFGKNSGKNKTVY